MEAPTEDRDTLVRERNSVGSAVLCHRYLPLCRDEIDIVPAHSTHIRAPLPSKQRDHDKVSESIVRFRRQRVEQLRELVRSQKPPPPFFGELAYPFRGIDSGVHSSGLPEPVQLADEGKHSVSCVQTVASPYIGMQAHYLGFRYRSETTAVPGRQVPPVLCFIFPPRTFVKLGVSLEVKREPLTERMLLRARLSDGGWIETSGNFAHHLTCPISCLLKWQVGESPQKESLGSAAYFPSHVEALCARAGDAD